MAKRFHHGRHYQSSANKGVNDLHELSERQTELAARFTAHADQTAATLEAVARTIEAANLRAEEDKRIFRDSLEKISADWFKKLDIVTHETNRRFDSSRPNWLGLLGLLTAVLVPVGALVGFSVRSYVAPVIERQNLIFRSLEGHLSTPGHTQSLVDNARLEIKIESLSKEVDRLHDLIDWQKQP